MGWWYVLCTRPCKNLAKHFGNEVFEKLDNFDPDNEDILTGSKETIYNLSKKDGPKNALEYMTPTDTTKLNR